MTAAKEPRAGASRSRLGRYELVARIAAGGMAEVYVARVRGEGGFERLVAIKRMLPNIAEDERFAEMFLDEGRISGHIESPHVVQILDVGRDDGDGTLFIAMELVRGVALHRLLSAVARAREAVPAPIAAALIAQAAEGLGAAHEATTPLGEPLHIVHRDVSPQNVLCGVDGRIRVADFGIARAVHRRSNTSTGELKGKLAYFAPEQLRAQPADARSDVFALGVVAWETFAQRRLFQGEHPLETMERIRAHEPEPLDVIRRDVPVGVAIAVARALAKDPEKRTPTARAFADELRASIAVADGAAVAAFVRRFAQDEVRALDDRIKAALTGAQTVTMPLPPVMGEHDSSGIVASGHGDSTQALDAPTLVTPSARLSLPGFPSPGAPRVPPPPPPRAATPAEPAQIQSETSMNLRPATGRETSSRKWIVGGVLGALVCALVAGALALWAGGGDAVGPVATELPVGAAPPAAAPSAAPSAPSAPSAAPGATAAPIVAGPASTPTAAPSTEPPPAEAEDTTAAGSRRTGRASSGTGRRTTASAAPATAARGGRDDDEDEPRTPPAATRGAEPEPERRGGLRGRDSFLGDLAH